MSNRCCKSLVANCDANSAGIDRDVQVDLWEKDRFDKFEWESQSLPISTGGLSRVLSAFRAKLGQIGQYDHVPVVWAKGSNIQDELNLSASGYWGPLQRAEDLGFVFRINQHGVPGTRKLIICKMPCESEFHAIARAKGAVERFMAKKPSVPQWVLYALRVELNNRIAADSVVLVVGNCEPGYQSESLNCRDSASGNQKPGLCNSEAPTYIEQGSYRNSSGEGSHETRATINNAPPPLSPSSENLASSRQKESRVLDDVIKNILSEIQRSKNLADFPKALRLLADAVQGVLPLAHAPESQKSTLSEQPGKSVTNSDSEEVEFKRAEVTAKLSTRSPLGVFLGDLFDIYGVGVKEQTLALISTSYESSMGDTEATRRELRAKIVRLAEAGFKSFKIAGFLLDDCPEPQNFQANSDREYSTETGAVMSWDDSTPPETIEVASSANFEEPDEFSVVRDELKTRTSSHNYRTWLEKLVCVQLAERVVVLGAPDLFHQAWVEEKFFELIRETINDVLPQVESLELIALDNHTSAFRASAAGQ